MKINKENKLLIACCVLAIALFIASLISISVYDTYSKGVSQSDVTVYVDGVELSRVEALIGSSHEVEIDAKDGVECFIHLDAQYGYVSDNKTIHIKDGQTSFTRIPLRVTLMKNNYAVSEYTYYLTVGSM